MKILVVKPSSLGDILHTLPAVELLRQDQPQSTVHWVVNRSLSGILDFFPAVDERIAFDRERLGRVRNAVELARFFRMLHRRSFDVAIDFQGLFRSGVIGFVSGARRRIGFRNAREGAALLYTETVRVPAEVRHAVDRNVFLVRTAFGIEAPVPEPRLVAPPGFAEAARGLWARLGFAEPDPVLAVAPAARWTSKTWPPEFFAEVLDRVAGRVANLRCWLLGTRDEQSAARAVADACRQARPQSLAGETDLGTLVELLRGSRGLLTNDSGPMHLAAALGVPTVALFGPTDPSLTGPYGARHAVFCGRCQRAPCLERICPLDRQVCAADVSAEAVTAAVVGILRSGTESKAR